MSVELSSSSSNSVLSKLRSSVWEIQKAGTMMIVFGILSFIILSFIILPVIYMVLRSEPGALVETFFDFEVQNALILTLYTATTVVLISLVFGVPLAYILARVDFQGKGTVESLIDIPILLPHTVSGLALLSIFGTSGLIGGILEPFNIVFRDTILGILIAQLFVSCPFLIKPARDAFEQVNPNLERAARTLGATKTTVFFKITFPMAARGILTGCVLTWARAISEFGAVIILAYYPYIAPVLIFRRFEGWGLSNSQPIAVILVLVTVAIFLILRFLEKKPLKTYRPGGEK
ncbi:MAG: ABC transporter permease subunit [Promethearchaeota archaeon]